MFGKITITNGISDYRITKIGYLTLKESREKVNIYWIEDYGINVGIDGLYYNLRPLIGLSMYNLIVQQLEMMDGVTNLGNTEMEFMYQLKLIEKLKPILF